MPNLSTFIVLLIVVLVFVAIILKAIKNKKEGKGVCSCGCDSCNLKDSCHKK